MRDIPFEMKQLAIRKRLLSLSAHIESAAKDLDDLQDLDRGFDHEIKLIADSLDLAIAGMSKINEHVSTRLLAYEDAQGVHDG